MKQQAAPFHRRPLSGRRSLAFLVLSLALGGSGLQAADDQADVPAGIGVDSPAPLPTIGPALPAEPPARPARELPLPIDEVRIFAQVLNQIRSAYVEEIDDRTLLENAIKGMLAGIDPHSAYLAADDYDSLQESTTGEFGGLGVEIGIENGFIKIIAPMDDSPAARAGIRAGDLIIRLDDTPAGNVTLNDTSELLRGEPGTSITLTILREGEPEPLKITVTREIIRGRSVRYRALEPGYGYIRIAQFSTETGKEVVNALGKLHEEEAPLKGVILDLRNNPGGVLQSGVEVADAFLSEGLIVSTRGRHENAEMHFQATPEDPSRGVPVAVLINGGTASASEIVAGALQDHSRAVIMGTQSFGKGSVQSVLQLTNDRAIKLTTSLYYTPKGRSIQARGITPDIEIDRGQVTRIPDSVMAYREANLNRHLEADDGQDTTRGTTETPQQRPSVSAAEVVVNDYQLNEALILLKGINVYRSL